ncbi:cell wall hydrolase [Allosphingosinicella sp.]|uniref:cell wall hydrolase n=1 Tax=Allosphingosinicella sp. TaxID=2823234 RepID=UPI003784D7D3
MRLILSGFALASGFLAAPAFAGGGTAEPYAASRDPSVYDRSLQCLTEAIYYEARNQSDDGQRAVAQVVLNRVRHPAYPNTVCGVVYQGSERTTGCQFSFTCTGVMGPIGDPVAWDRARRIANAALRGSVYRPVGLAVNYHTTAIHPYWAPSLNVQATVGAHIFYTRPDSPTVEAFSQMPANYEPQTFGRQRGERYENVQAEQPVYAPRMRERFAPVMSYGQAQQRRVPGRDRYAPIQIAEIPIPERELVYRTYGPRPTQRAIQASSSDGVRPAQRQAPARSGPRVVRQSNGIRIVYGN